MRALVLERRGELKLRDMDLPTQVGPNDVRIAIENVGVCGSDVHYYTHGRIGPYVVNAPMVLGHEASGRVTEVGSAVKSLAVGDRVCMEPGIPDSTSRASRIGMYNVDPSVVFWATPPVHGCLTQSVVHPAAFTYRLPGNVSFAEGAMVEPLAIGMQAAVKARIQPGDVAVVTGCGTIGILTALAALAGGCSRVLISDVLQAKLDVAARYPGITPVNVKAGDLAAAVREATDGWGADVVFEASGSPAVYKGMFDVVRPGGCVVLVGIPHRPGRVRCGGRPGARGPHRDGLPLRQRVPARHRPDRVGQGRPEAAHQRHLRVRGRDRGPCSGRRRDGAGTSSSRSVSGRASGRGGERGAAQTALRPPRTIPHPRSPRAPR